ncbi:DUF5615 family PIN-like protein [Leptolyngbya cf. ectocarpi LEGE 11479]|uniref:DUF5615 family PIN-like protein n=1 Tax=Leptolyngbya cf. ectocarpi LEGE 11479 TaxID=1828722 RepID=A0A929FCR4_LEPEC|nr:DUF5615 family PIN-like protein [Leptolyngbya ectocarpi]MBE9070342.1 DUF5615 family PIN-like protein [Leptolyngbya cf. ectocarpi LEGE 11479]
MSVALYMDENVPRQITTGLRLRSIDVLTVQEDSRAGIADPEVLDRATKLKRILFSRDDDLLAIANQRQQQGQFFYGIIYSHPQRSSIGDCIRNLELIAAVCDVEDCLNQVQYLPM